MVPRPDELAAESEIGRDVDTRNLLRKGASAASIGAGIISGSLGSKILPFLSPYISSDTAIKGIGKISPKIGDFLKRGKSMGLDVKDGLDFLKDKIEKSPVEKESRNIIQQSSPELHQFIEQEIRNGRNLFEAGAIAQNDKRFSSVIEKLSKDHKIPWSSILQSVYGQSSAQNGQQSAQNSQQPQNGSGHQALISILQKIQKSRGG